jgi:hypothetical protein
MKCSDIVKQAVLLLQESQRLTYRALKLEFELTDEQLDVLKEELIEAREVVVDKDGKMLVWVGGGGTGETEKRRNGEATVSPQPLTSNPQPFRGRFFAACHRDSSFPRKRESSTSAEIAAQPPGCPPARA